jgi:hypothetical protein
MKQFLGGVLVASFLSGGLLWAQAAGVIDLFGQPERPTVDTDAGVVLEVAPQAGETGPKKRGKRRSKTQGTRAGGSGYETGEGFAGDDLEGSGARDLDMGGPGKEQQLTPAQIDAGIDQVWSGIRRCLVLVPPGAPATGKVIVGMRIAPGGEIAGANLTGPNDIIKGECGACIRRAVMSIRYPSFDGPEMTVRYPIVFE